MSRAIIGEHPTGHAYGVFLAACDKQTDSGFQHRELTENGRTDSFLAHTVNVLRLHHLSDEALERRKVHIASFKIKGLDYSRLSPYPHDDNVRKGNFAEVITAEYLDATTPTSLPVYRLRYNTNVNQSMKGEDVLLFDLDSDPIRIIVAESKFRKAPSKADVIEMVEGLERSHSGTLPVSLAFVSDRLYDEGKAELGEKVMKCAELFATDKLNIDYVGLMLGNANTSANIQRNVKSQLHNLLVISLGVNEPENLVLRAFDELEGEL
ncbi:hypothetical protein FACS1894208_06490 [Clostridia bacterium]|nr:hypothetical protein FACS1894208_06490 [Clostridia bacterium]